MPHPEHTPAPPNRTQTVRFGGALFTGEERDEETDYGYCNEYQPHAVKRMFDYKNEMLYDMRWDEAGNLGQVSMAKLGDMFEWGRFLFWTEDNRMHAAVDDKYFSHYAYDHSGERRLKLTGDNRLLDVNADFMSTYTVLNEPTLYPSAYMVLNNKGYTKHYYAGTERVAARLGGGGLDALYHVIGNDEELQVKADMLFKQSLEHVNYRVLHENDLDCIMHNDFAKEEFGHWIDGIPYQMQAGVELKHDQFKDMINSMLDDINHGQEKEVYFYHSDHLGSASWITDFSGMAVQHIQYLPYGEPYVNQHPFGYSERFTFTGKERDEETGYGYFGARYMDHELMTMWLSVDPMADKYPSISPYNYCMWNPMKLIDPDGCDTLVFNKYGNYSHSIKSDGEHVGRYEQPSGNPYTFTFADPINDPIAIEEGKITKLQIVKEDDIKKMLRDAGVFCDDNRKRKYGYAKEEGVGLGKLDFSKKAEKGMASLYEINTYKSMYLIDGVAHNPENFGNFLYGAACEALGFSLFVTKLGAHYNSRFGDANKNGYSHQWDSQDDQFSIKCGYRHAKNRGYHNINHNWLPGPCLP